MSSPGRLAATTDRRSLDPGAGLLELELGLDAGGRTVLVGRRQRFPLRLTVPLYADPADPGTPLLLVQNPTGGLFPGDRLETVLTAGASTRVQLSTPSATKAYAPPVEDAARLAPAFQRTRVVASDGAFVEIVPQAMIPHAGARVISRTEIVLARHAVVLACEQLAAGRVAHGERFAYERVELSVGVHDEQGTELAADAIVLEPGRAPPARRGLQGSFAHLATLVVAGLDLDTARLASSLDVAAGAARGVAAGAGELPSGAGVAVRLLGPSAPTIAAALAELRAVVRRELLGLPLPPARGR